MTEPKGTIYKGDLNIEAGLDTTDFGFGDLTIARGITLNSGSAVSNSIVSLNATASSILSTTLGTLSLSSTDSSADGLLSLSSAGTTTSAISLNASAGGISLLAVKDTSLSVSSAEASTLLISEDGDVGNKISILSSTSTLTDSINISSVAGGIKVSAAEDVSIEAGASASLKALAGGMELNVESSAATDDLLIVNTNGTNNEAVQVKSLAGGILMEADKLISLQSAASISIATATSGVPVTIGTSSSTTTIMGNLMVSGSTTTIESETLTVQDNVILVNSAPSGTADGGLAVKRFQQANDSGTGDVVGDLPVSQDTAQSGSATTITLSAASNANDDYYNGFWVKIISGTGANQARRIKAYVGSTKVATIYDTSDGGVEGMNFSTNPTSDSVYGLYDCPFVVSIYDESSNEWVLGCTSLDPATAGQPDITHYLNLHVKDLQVDGNLQVEGTINSVSLSKSEIVTLVDNAITQVDITKTLQYGAYLIQVKEVASNDLLAATVDTGSFSVFSAAGRGGRAGNIARLSSATGADGEKLDVSWASGEKIKLSYRPSPSGGSGDNRYYFVKIDFIA